MDLSEWIAAEDDGSLRWTVSSLALMAVGIKSMLMSDRSNEIYEELGFSMPRSTRDCHTVMVVQT
jgi:hypothetical protein